jgi:hypothetical protein
MLPTRRSPSRRTAGRARLVAGLVAAAAAAPLAVPSVASAACPAQPQSTPFAVFGDTSSYFLAPFGGFESGPTGWTLAGGASVGFANEAWHVGGPADTRSAVLPASGASATSSPFCVDASTPTIRFFVRSDGFAANAAGSLSVDAHFANPQTGADLGTVHLATLGRHDGAWTPTRPIALGVGTALRGGLSSAAARLTFTARGARAASFSVDDVYVDPWQCC